MAYTMYQILWSLRKHILVTKAVMDFALSKPLANWRFIGHVMIEIK